MTHVFCSYDGQYTVTVTGDCAAMGNAESVWFFSVGKLLTQKGDSPENITRAYAASKVGNMQQQSVLKRLRYPKKLPGRVTLKTDFVQQPVPAPPSLFSGQSAKKFNEVRSVVRHYRREAEDHLKDVMVLVGVLFRSARGFALANRIIGNQPRSDNPDGRPGRVKSAIGDTSFPMWHNVDRFYDTLVVWANQKVAMGTSIRCFPTPLRLAQLRPCICPHLRPVHTLAALSATTTICVLCACWFLGSNDPPCV